MKSTQVQISFRKQQNKLNQNKTVELKVALLIIIVEHQVLYNRGGDEEREKRKARQSRKWKE